MQNVHTPIYTRTHLLFHTYTHVHIHTPLTCPLVTDPARWSCGTLLGDDAVCWIGSVWQLHCTCTIDSCIRVHMEWWRKMLQVAIINLMVHHRHRTRNCREGAETDCCVCSGRTPGDNGTRLLYHCATCSTKPSLCVCTPGFEAYHTQRNYHSY